MKMCFKLIVIQRNHPITRSSDPSFLHLIQHGLLLELKDRGNLTEMQFRHAEDILLRQYRENRTLCIDEAQE